MLILGRYLDQCLLTKLNGMKMCIDSGPKKPSVVLLVSSSPREINDNQLELEAIHAQPRLRFPHFSICNSSVEGDDTQDSKNR